MSVIPRRKRTRNEQITNKSKPAYSSKLPISVKKYNDLMDFYLKGGIPPHFHHEYKNLPFSSCVRDAVPKTDEEENSSSENEGNTVILQ